MSSGILFHDMKKKIINELLPSKVLVTEKIALLEELLAKGLRIRIQVTGKSMSPFLQGGEILTIRRVPCNTLCKGDLIFFKTPENIPVIHRIVKKKRAEDNMYSFKTKGDSVLAIDEPVRENDILGKVCRIEKTATTGKRKQVDMEMPIWKGLNYSLALVSLGKEKIASHPALAGLLRRIKKALVTRQMKTDILF
jgi:signal peptidase I